MVHLLVAGQSCYSLWCREGRWRKASANTVERDLLQSVPSVSLAACLALPVVYHLICFRRAKLLKVMVGRQARLDHYLLLYHQGSTSACKMTCIFFHSPLCLVESNHRASPPFPAQKVVVSILLAWQS